MTDCSCGGNHTEAIDEEIVETEDVEIAAGLDEPVEVGKEEAVLKDMEATLMKLKEVINMAFKAHKVIGNYFTPVGVVHGWSPKSMADAACEMVKMGYKYLALGGMVPLKSPQIMSALNAVRSEIPKDVELHILGFAKSDDLNQFIGKGINSIDTTSPLLRAFKDNKNNLKYDFLYTFYN